MMALREEIKLVNAHEGDAAQDEINDVILQAHENTPFKSESQRNESIASVTAEGVRTCGRILNSEPCPE